MLSGTFQIICEMSLDCLRWPFTSSQMAPFVQRAHGAARMDGAQRRGLVEGLAHFPGAALLLHFALQVAAGHVQAQRIAPDAVVGLLDRNIAAALAQHHDQLHPRSAGWTSWAGKASCRFRRRPRSARRQRACRRRTVFAAGEAHFLGVLGVVAADAIDTAHRKARAAADDGNRGLRGRRQYVVHADSTYDLSARPGIGARMTEPEEWPPLRSGLQRAARETSGSLSLSGQGGSAHAGVLNPGISPSNTTSRAMKPAM